MLRRWMIGVLALLVFTASPAWSAEASSYYPYGQCTYWALQERPDLAGEVTGNAWYWGIAAENAGLTVDGTPTSGSVAVFQPGVQGAWSAGHVAYVVAVGQDGWFQVSEMDFPYPGVVSYRWAHTGWGVSFIH